MLSQHVIQYYCKVWCVCECVSACVFVGVMILTIDPSNINLMFSKKGLM